MEEQNKFTVYERIPKTFKYATELPRAVFSRPDIPFKCEIRRHKRKFFGPIVVCSFEDYVPAYNKDFDKLRGYKFDTINLFFPSEAKYLMPPHKIASRDEYGSFNINDRDYLHTKFITRFSYMSDIKDKKNYLEHRPIYKKMFEKYPEDNIEDSYLADEAQFKVRKIVADNPVVRINDKKEIINGPF